MKIRKLIEDLLKDNTLDDEIIVSYWDKNYFVEWNEMDRNQVDSVWDKFVVEAQETVEGNNEFTRTGYELTEDLEEMIKENGESS